MSFFREKLVTTKKSHRCWGCGQSFPAGSQLLSQAGVNSGEFWSGYQCEPCGLIERAIYSHPDYCPGDEQFEGWLPGELINAAVDFGLIPVIWGCRP